ncbi:MAG: OsmC family protein [Terricaulis sp.]
MAIIRTASVVWTGDIKAGNGEISTESGALASYPYGFAARFEGQKGSNPEELLGAAHASCFTMATAAALAKAGLAPERLETKARITLDKEGEGWAIKASHLSLEATIPGTDDATFQRIAADAKANCPLSQVIKADISLEATLK